MGSPCQNRTAPPRCLRGSSFPLPLLTDWLVCRGRDTIAPAAEEERRIVVVVRPVVVVLRKAVAAVDTADKAGHTHHTRPESSQDYAP